MFQELAKQNQEQPTLPIHVLRMVVQVVLSTLLAWFICLILEMVGLDEIHRPSLIGISVQLIRPAMIGAVGLIAGSFVYSEWPQMRPTSLWQWLVPLALLIVAMGVDARLFGFAALWGEYFAWERPGIDEPAMGNYLLIYPTISALCYSTGAALMSKRAKVVRAGDTDTTR